jgi:hypothetical protein
MRKLVSSAFSTFLFAAAFGVVGSACAGADEGPLDEEASAVGVSEQALVSKQALAPAAAIGGKVVAPTTGGSVVYFQCGWDPKSLSAQCSCHGDADCNRMFTSGFCGANASCDSGAGTCTCDLKL